MRQFVRRYPARRRPRRGRREHRGQPGQQGGRRREGQRRTAAHGVRRALTAREREVVGRIATGLSNEEIARQVYVSLSTVKTHATRAMTKLGARDRAQLVVVAHQGGLVRPGWSVTAAVPTSSVSLIRLHDPLTAARIVEDFGYAKDLASPGALAHISRDGGAGPVGVMPDMTGLRRNGYFCRARRGAVWSAPGGRRHAAGPGGRRHGGRARRAGLGSRPPEPPGRLRYRPEMWL